MPVPRGVPDGDAGGLAAGDEHVHLVPVVRCGRGYSLLDRVQLGSDLRNIPGTVRGSLRTSQWLHRVLPPRGDEEDGSASTLRETRGPRCWSVEPPNAKQIVLRPSVKAVQKSRSSYFFRLILDQIY